MAVIPSQDQELGTMPNQIRGREGRHRPPLPFRTVHETFTSHGS
ncbi:hypothetical protein MiTs_00869 [Microcystis aeruginosa NIES-2521]|uniref:Uncharacterized protein n=1 Tax=Microcystis aeruginosa NIES-2521 TaxID=2303983 RepID=A0A5A5S0G8_MICAE|nr:hypothetical protein MiTs_00869 [Microcystis aeruginosa NIES-2521]